MPFKGLSKLNCLAIDNHVYVCGGIADSEARKVFCRYDIIDRPRQMILSPMKSPRSDCVLIHLDNYIYAIGGVEARIEQVEFETRAVERYDLSKVRYDTPMFERRVNPWESVEFLPASCWRPHGIVYKGRILVCGLESKAPRVNYIVRSPNPTIIQYVLYIYNPYTNNWDKNLLTERPSIMAMHGRQNFVTLLAHKGECYLIGSTEVPSYNNPTTMWFRLIVNKLKFEEGAGVKFIEVGESINQDLMTWEYYSSFFYIGDDVFFKWDRNIIKIRDLKVTDSNLKEVTDAYINYPNQNSLFTANSIIDVKWLY